MLPKELTTQSAITCSKLTLETLEQGVKYVQSLVFLLLLTFSIAGWEQF